MHIITAKNTLDTNNEAIVLMFEDDKDLTDFISKIVTTPIKRTGMRLIHLIPENLELSPLQKSILSVLENLDGIGGEDHDSIVDDAVSGLKDILNSKNPKQ